MMYPDGPEQREAFNEERSAREFEELCFDETRADEARMDVKPAEPYTLEELAAIVADPLTSAEAKRLAVSVAYQLGATMNQAQVVAWLNGRSSGDPIRNSIEAAMRDFLTHAVRPR